MNDQEDAKKEEEQEELRCYFCGSTKHVNEITMDCYQCYKNRASWQPWNWPR